MSIRGDQPLTALSDADPRQLAVAGVRRRDARLVPIAVLAWGVALWAIHVPEAAGTLCLIALGLTGSALVLAWRTHRTIFALAAIACGVAVVVSGHVAAAVDARDDATSAAVSGGRAIEVLGTVVTKVEPTTRGQLRFTVDAEVLGIGDQRQSVRVPIMVRVPAGQVDEPDRLDLGSRIRASGTARETDPGESAVLIVSAARGVEVLASPAGLFAVSAGLRDSFVRLAAGLPAPGGDLLPGLAVGDTGAVSDELDQAMKASSLSHLTAVSGANCAIVVGIAFAVAAALRAPRWLRITAALLTLAGFVLLVTPEASVIRAAAMASVAMIALGLDRAGAGLAVFSLAVTVLLAADPWLASSIGFSLSVAATAALLTLARPIAAGMARIMPQSLALAIAVPLAAQLACGPLLIIIEPSIPVYGVVANMIAAPAAPIATVIGLIACLVATIPGLGLVFAWIAWLPSAWIAATATTFAGLPGARLPWIDGWVGAGLLAVLGVAVASVIVPRARRWYFRATQRIAVGVCAVVVGVASGAVVRDVVVDPLRMPSEWAVAQCDVGQGDAVVLRSGGETALIDTGDDVAALDSCLRTLRVEHVELLVLTHFDADHVGAANLLLGRTHTVVHGPTGDASDERLLSAFRNAGADVVFARAGLGGTLGSARWQVLWPRGASRAFPAGNDASVVLDVRETDAAGTMPRGLFLGDLSEVTQRVLLGAQVLAPRYDVVKVAHHGSADQAPELYRGTAAAIALIGVGADNTFGHPRAEVLDELARVGARIARSDQNGLALARIDGEGALRLWLERPGGVSGRG